MVRCIGMEGNKSLIIREDVIVLHLHEYHTTHMHMHNALPMYAHILTHNLTPRSTKRPASDDTTAAPPTKKSKNKGEGGWRVWSLGQLRSTINFMAVHCYLYL